MSDDIKCLIRGYEKDHSSGWWLKGKKDSQLSGFWGAHLSKNLCQQNTGYKGRKDVLPLSLSLSFVSSPPILYISLTSHNIICFCLPKIMCLQICTQYCIVTSGCSHGVVGWLCNGFSFYRTNKFTKGVRGAVCEFRNSCSCEQLNFFCLESPSSLMMKWEM